MPHRDSHDVVMIGAGACGLTEATAQHPAGRDTVCLEARDRIGGRMLTASTAGSALDPGSHLVLGR